MSNPDEIRRKIDKEHKLLREGRHPDQVRISDATVVRIHNIRFEREGLEAIVDIDLDGSNSWKDARVGREQNGKPQTYLGEARSYRMFSYPTKIVDDSINEAIHSLLDEIMPPAKPYGLNRETGVLTTAKTPQHERVDPADFAEARAKANARDWVRHIPTKK